MSIEIATHPDDLLIVCAETKDYPGKFVTDFYRGEGHRYKPILTCDREEAFADGRETAIDRIRTVLETVSFHALYHGSAPKNSDEFVKCIREAGYIEERVSNEKIAEAYNRFAEKDVIGLLSGMIDVKRVMNAAMIDEIMGRLATEDTCDTSQNPLASFPGPPTY